MCGYPSGFAPILVRFAIGGRGASWRPTIYLTPDSVVPYLLQKGILTTRDLVCAEWGVRRLDTLRPVIEVRRRNGSGWIVKQPPRLEQFDVEALDREAALYELGARGPLSRHLPHVRSYDRGIHALIIELLPHETVWNRLREPAADAAYCGEALARAFAALHRLADARDWSSAFLPRTPPWILALQEPNAFSDLGEAERQVLDSIDSDPVLSRALTDLGRAWRCEAVIHGDARLDNLIYRLPPKPHCWIIDWGLARIGDPAWDIAGVIHSALVLWLNGVSFNAERDVRETMRQATIPLAAVRAFTAAFVRAYVSRRALPNEQVASFVSRSVRLAGARLVQAMLEHARTTRALMRRHVAMLKLARGTLDDPSGFIGEFIGGD